MAPTEQAESPQKGDPERGMKGGPDGGPYFLIPRQQNTQILAHRNGARGGIALLF